MEVREDTRTIGLNPTEVKMGMPAPFVALVIELLEWKAS